MSKRLPFRWFSNDDELYDFIVNDWIIKQPDCDDLMALFIQLKFDLREFIHAIFDHTPGGSRKSKAA